MVAFVSVYFLFFLLFLTKTIKEEEE